MKKIAVLMILMALLCCLCGCKGEASLKFYVVEGEYLTGGESETEMLSIAKKSGRLVFTDADIEGYLWSEHRIRLKEAPVRGSIADGGSRLFQAEANDRFLLVLGNRVIYFGGFAAGSGSAAIQISPYIIDEGAQTFSIAYSSKYSEGEDPRGDQRLYRYLTEHQLLSSKLNEEK